MVPVDSSLAEELDAFRKWVNGLVAAREGRPAQLDLFDEAVDR
jgi:hypothetical protein